MSTFSPISVPQSQVRAADIEAVVRDWMRSSEYIGMAQDGQHRDLYRARRVTSLPTAGIIDGDEIDYSPESGTTWRFRFRSGLNSAYRWEFVGGAPLANTVSGESTTAATHTTYQNLADGAGAQVLIPLAGEYVVSFGAYLICSGGTNHGYVSVKFGTAEATDTDGQIATTTSTAYVPIARTGLAITVTTAGTYANLRYRATSNTTVNFGRRHITVIPVRVG